MPPSQTFIFTNPAARCRTVVRVDSDARVHLQTVRNADDGVEDTCELSLDTFTVLLGMIDEERSVLEPVLQALARQQRRTLGRAS